MVLFYENNFRKYFNIFVSFFLQIIGAVLAYRFRNLQDPGKAQATANPLYAPQYS